MSRLKCIGGEAHGKFMEVPDNIKIGDHVRIEQDIKFKSDTFEEGLKAFRGNKSLDYVTIKYLIYRITTIAYNDMKIRFLVPENWTDAAALKFALTE